MSETAFEKTAEALASARDRAFEAEDQFNALANKLLEVETSPAKKKYIVAMQDRARIGFAGYLRSLKART